MRKRTRVKPINYFFWASFWLLFLLLIYFFVKNFFHSLFFKQKERINLVFYGERTFYYSLDKKGEINYYLFFPPDLKMMVPGGYGQYRLGGLGKLVSLEKKPDLFKKTFSLATSSFVDYYFYPKKVVIYYGFEDKNKFLLPPLIDLFTFQSNANFFDRLYLFYYFLTKSQKNYLSLPLIYNNKKIFNEKEFFEKIQGYLYKKSLRQEDLNLQIIFHQSYKTALSISSIIEGEGIKVNDLTQKEKESKGCLILENRKKHSLTSETLRDFFRCQILNQETTPYDIILILNKEEDNWWY